MIKYEKEPCFEDENFDNEQGGIDYIIFNLKQYLKDQPKDELCYKLVLYKEKPQATEAEGEKS